MMKKLRVVFYARVSTDNEDQLHSFAAQQEYFKNYIIQNKDMVYVTGYADEGISGISTKKRIGFLKMIEDARLGKFDLILTKEVSRFARNTVDTLTYTRELSRLGVGVVFTNDGIDTRQKDGELRLTIMASLAQDESRKISDRVNWAVQRNYENGVAHGGMPYGYRRNENKEIVVYEPEAIYVRKMFDLYLQGLGFLNVCKELNKLSSSLGETKKWIPSCVAQMLSNPKYCGDLVQGLSYTEDFLSKSRKLQKDTNKLTYIKDHHCPIISRDIFEKTQIEKKRRADLRKRKVKTTYSKKSVFSNKVICAHCLSAYIRKTSMKKEKRYTVWKCSKKDRFGKTACKEAENIKEEVLYRIMQETYQYLHVNVEEIIRKLEAVFNVTMNSSDTEEELKQYKNDICVLNKQLEKLIDLNIQGFIPLDMFEKKYQELTSEINEKENYIKRLKGDDNTVEDFNKKLNRLKDILREKAENWKEIKDELINRILDKIEVVNKEEYNVFIKIRNESSEFSYKNGYFPPSYSSVE